MYNRKFHNPFCDSYYKISHIFILEKYHLIISSNVHDKNLEHNEHCDQESFH